MPIARLHSRRNLTLAMNLLSNYEKITASYQINISGSESILSNVKNSRRITLKSTVRQTSFQKAHLHFVLIFKLSISAFFCICCSIYLHVLSSIFVFPHNLVTAPINGLLISINKFLTQLL